MYIVAGWGRADVICYIMMRFAIRVRCCLGGPQSQVEQ